MKKSKDIIKIIVLVSIIVFKINFEVYASLAYSPEEGSKIESFIEKNNDLLSSEEKSNLNDIVIKLNKKNKIFSTLFFTKEEYKEREILNRCLLMSIVPKFKYKKERNFK